MHIADGVLNIETCVAGYAVTAALVGLALKKTKPEDVPKVSVMGAAFFISSLIHFKVGVSSVHLTFIGLTGLILGLKSPLALIAGLLFQALMFQHGGLVVLGVNGSIFMLPALLAAALFSLVKGKWPHKYLLISVLAGIISALSMMLAAFLVWLVLVTTGEEFQIFSLVFSLSQLALVLVEGVISGLVVYQFLRIKPGILLGNSISKKTDRND